MTWMRTTILLAAVLMTGCRAPSSKQAALPPAGEVALPARADRSSSIVPLPPVEDFLPAVKTSEVVHATALEELSSPTSDASAPEVISATILSAESQAAAIPPPLRLDLFQSLETALVQNPDLTALRRNEGVSVAALGVARTYPFNPFVQMQTTPFQDNKSGGSGTVYHYVLLMQQIQLGHQQRFREENALATLQSVRWNIMQAELLNVAQTERLYFTAIYLRGLRDLVQAGARLNDEMHTVIKKRLAAGDASAADTTIVRLDRDTSRRQAQLAEANYQTALLDLRRHLNLPISIAYEPIGDLSDWQWLAPWSETPPSVATPGFPTEPAAWAASLTSARPDVMAARADLAAARANIDFARGARIPDLQIGPYYQRSESGTTFVGFRAQADIPVLNNGTPLVRQREAETRQRHAVWQQLHIRAQREAEAAIDRYVRARTAAAENTDEVESLPTELEKLERQFRANEVDFIRIVTARTSLINARRAELDLLNEAAQAAVVVTASTGLPPESILRLKRD